MRCKTCGEELRGEFCPVCDYGWDPADRSNWDSFGREHGMPPSVPYTKEGEIDVEAARSQVPIEELDEILTLERILKLPSTPSDKDKP